jgi:hypothetical protein
MSTIAPDRFCSAPSMAATDFQSAQEGEHNSHEIKRDSGQCRTNEEKAGTEPKWIGNRGSELDRGQRRRGKIAPM